MKMIIKMNITNKKGEVFTVLFDGDDYEILKCFNWIIHKNKYTSYAETSVTKDGKTMMIGMHRLLLGIGPGNKKVVDHKNGNGLDNRRCNIRLCSQSQNLMNKTSHKGSSSIFLGVSYDTKNKKWFASISINGRLKNLGRFTNEEDAAKERDKYAIIHHKQFAKLNFPNN